MILMAIYHFCFDLNAFGVLHEQMNAAEGWLIFRAVIMTLFTGLVGVGLFLGRADWRSQAYWKRALQISACAAVISVVTYQMYGESWVFFGVLHLAALTTFLGPGLRRAPILCLLGGSVLVILPLIYRDSIFYQPGLVITGLSPMKPFTEDFAPLCPWLGVSLVGLFLGYIVRQTPQFRIWSWQIPPLTRLGRHALAFYMLHQCVLYPLAWVVSQLRLH